MSHVRDAGNNNYKASGAAVGQLASNKAATAQKRASFAAAISTLLKWNSHTRTETRKWNDVAHSALHFHADERNLRVRCLESMQIRNCGRVLKQRAPVWCWCEQMIL
jgi:hypothetical protein